MDQWRHKNSPSVQDIVVGHLNAGAHHSQATSVAGAEPLTQPFRLGQTSISRRAANNHLMSCSNRGGGSPPSTTTNKHQQAVGQIHLIPNNPSAATSAVASTTPLTVKIDSQRGAEFTPQFPISGMSQVVMVGAAASAAVGPTTGPISKSKKMTMLEMHDPPSMIDLNGVLDNQVVRHLLPEQND